MADLNIGNSTANVKVTLNQNGDVHFRNGTLDFDSSSLPQFSGTPSYLVGIEPFSNGGTLKWAEKASVSVGSADKLTTARTIWGQSFNGTANISGNMIGVGNINTAEAPAGTIYMNNWFRSTGATGWYNETYGGGWYMTDSTYIRNYNSKTTRLDNLCLGADNNSYRLYVNGNSYFNGNTTHNGTDYFANGTSFYIDDSADANLRRGLFAGTSNADTDASSFFHTGALEVRESGRVGSSQSSFNYAPRIGFHWGNRIAATLSFHSDGIFYLRKQNGSDRATLDANLNGNAATATKWQTARTITLGSDASGSVAIDGSANVTLNVQNNRLHVNPAGRPASADLNLSTSPGNNELSWMYSTSTMTTNKPPTGDGIIINTTWDWGGYGAQLSIGNGGHLSVRGASSISNGEGANPPYDSTWYSWNTILDSNNYNDYSLCKISSSTDNAIARWNGTDGKSIQNSGILIDDNNNLLMGSGRSIYFNNAASGLHITNDETSAISLLNSSSALGLNVGNICISNVYSDRSKVPTNGLYVKGVTYVSDKIKNSNSWISIAGTSSFTCPDGTAITQPSGANPLVLYSGAASGRDCGIFYLSNDNAYVANSSDDKYVFGVFDTDITQNFSAEGNASLCVRSNGAGTFIRSRLGVNGINDSYNLYVNGTSYFNGTLKFADSQSIFFQGKGNSDSAYCQMGFMNGVPGGLMHCVTTSGQQADGAFYITSNGYNSGQDHGGIAIDNEGVTVFGAGDPGNNFTGVFRVINEDNVAAGPVFRVQKDGKAYASALYGAVWNDYAEYRSSNITEPGRVIIENGDGTLSLSTERLQRGAEIISDTFGFAIGETDECKTPIAVSGRVLAYYSGDIKEFKPGYPVCSGPNGTVSVMTEEEEEKYPSRIIGTVSEIPTYEKWGTGNVEVNGRIWIRIR